MSLEIDRKMLLAYHKVDRPICVVTGKREDVMKKIWKKMIYEYGFLAVTGVIVLSLVLFCVLRPDNLMHSDTTAEVILSKLLADENKLITKNWFYSTEIRIVYSQLIMMPLFKLFHSYRLVKFLSVFIFYILMIWAANFVSNRYGLKRPFRFLVLALFFTPLSNEYLDMMFIGCFYSSQAICTYVVLAVFAGWLEAKEQERARGIAFVAFAHVFALILGLSGLRYLASLFVPMVFAAGWILVTEEKDLWQERLMKNKSVFGFCLALTMLICAGIGFLINKYYLATHYSFDTETITFVDLSEVPDRFLNSVKLMIEFFGYYPVEVVSGRGIVNVIKLLLLCFFVGALLYVFHVRRRLTGKMRFLLYYFIGMLGLNWYMLVFTTVLMQYRYWIPVYLAAVLLMGVFFQECKPRVAWRKDFYAVCIAMAALSSLYGELWQDAKYNDCAKRYGYMEFLKANDYTFGYATFWNASITQYLSNGTIEVGNLGGKDGVAAPYEWLCKKALYQKGYHTGKTFLLLMRTEEAGMLKGDFTVMPDGIKVYEDEYYAIYEGEGMYLFSE